MWSRASKDSGCAKIGAGAKREKNSRQSSLARGHILFAHTGTLATQAICVVF